MTFMDSQLGMGADEFKATRPHVRWDRLGVFLAIVAFWVGAIMVLIAA